MRISRYQISLLLVGVLAPVLVAQQPTQPAPHPAAAPTAHPAAPPAAAPAAAPAALPAAAPAAMPMPNDSVPQLTPAQQRVMDSTRTAVRANRQKVVAANMDLTADENAKFWPLYREYRDSAGAISDRLFRLIARYGQQYNTLTDEQATRLMTDYAAIERDRMALRSAYIPKFGAILPPRKLVRYFQIENKLDAIINYDIAGEIPLVK